MRRAIHLLACALLCVSMLSGCGKDSQPALTLAPHVDLQRYAGRRYIIANIPYFAERGKVGSYFDVSFPDGKVKDVYYAHGGKLDALLEYFTMHGYVVPGTGNAHWRESPFWPIYLSYLILWVSPDYQYALAGYPGRGYGWVLSRSFQVDAATYRSLLQRFAAAGYDTALFHRVKQGG